MTGSTPAGSEVHYFSRFGGLWVDRSDAADLIERRSSSGSLSADDARLLTLWMKNGYVVLENAISPRLADQLLADTDRLWSDARMKAEDGPGNHVPPSAEVRKKRGRLRDIYFYSEVARQAIFADKIARFLRVIFERDILAFQSLSFDIGTEQGVHQDPAYVVVSSPLEMAASWIALEDIRDDSGPLTYYEGSHRLPEFIFGGKYKHWSLERDGTEVHGRYSRYLHEKAKEMGLPLRRLCARKGDAIIWHADLAHGGSLIESSDSQTTRRSLATHYCPADVSPAYLTYVSQQTSKIHYRGSFYYCSEDYRGGETPTPRSTAFSRIKPLIKPFIPPAVRKFVRRFGKL